MAATVYGGQVRRDRRRAHRPMSEINVTPMVDVMLVLLIIFMVTAPLLTVGVQVDLPKTKASVIPGQDEPLTITVDGEGRIYLQETELDLEVLAPRLIAITSNNPDVRIFLRFDKTIRYGRVMEVMGTVNGAGFTKIALITEPLGSGTAGKKRKKAAKK
ncbi:MAG: protein TolR [Proteobacteria bacterium]|nr:protein TolR [Pseudomonadota bacterium]MCH8212595.1 protein TolR [Pseudomonadota bacterium]